MVTFEQLVTQAQKELSAELDDDLSRAMAERVVRSLLAGVGFHVDNAGLVVDPRPAPNPLPPPRETGMYYSDQRRRRRRSGRR